MQSKKDLHVNSKQQIKRLDALPNFKRNVWKDVLKFIYSKKATKFCEISTNYLTDRT